MDPDQFLKLTEVLAVRTTWSNFLADPVAVGTFVAATSGILIAIGLESVQSLKLRRIEAANRLRRSELLMIRLFFALLDLHARLHATNQNLDEKFAVMLQAPDLLLAKHYFGGYDPNLIHEAGMQAYHFTDGIAHNVAQLSGMLWLYEDAIAKMLAAIERDSTESLGHHESQIREILSKLIPLADETFQISHDLMRTAAIKGNKALELNGFNYSA